MTPYVDTNFLTRIYLALPESSDADSLLVHARTNKATPLPVTWLHRVETLNAFQLHVYQSKLSGQHAVSSKQATHAYETFQADIQMSSFLKPAAISISALEEKFEEIALRRTMRYGFRTYDLLHVASALLLHCDTFWSFDSRAGALAKLEGLKVR